MKLKLPKKLPSPYTLAEWQDLGYDKDPKFTKTLKFLNLALINLKNTKPPTAEAFENFSGHTSFLIIRLKKMLADKEMPGPVREFCEPFYDLLRKWKKGAAKVQDILMEESEEEAGKIAAATKTLHQAITLGHICIKNYTAIVQAIEKGLKDITQLAAIINKGVQSPKLAAAVDQVRAEKLLKNIDAARKKCVSQQSKLPDAREIEMMKIHAKESNNAIIPSLASTYAAQLTNLEKLTKAADSGLDKYNKTAAAIIKAYETRSAS